jgi:D-alanyl-D-alanine carboxypeptidase/D-alanyl-D-alanine-endopeptidase (penicillin-binding protein 4)
MKGYGGRSRAPAFLAAAALLALIGAFFPAGSILSSGGRPAAASSVALRTGVLSPRRIPVLLGQALAELRLATGLDGALADPAIGGGRDQSCLIVRQGGATIYARRPALQLIPASNLKLLTATAVLDKLGASSKQTTEARADKAPAGGVIDGNLYLIGGGDPLLRTADYVTTLRFKELVYSHFDQLAQAVRRAGVTEIKGTVVGDESRYDLQRYVPSWKPSYASDGEVGPLSALEVNDGFAKFAPRLVASPDPAVAAATEFVKLLTARGIKVDGAPGGGKAPAATVMVAALPSLTIADSVGEILRQSDNTGVELLTKELGLRFGGGPSTAAGVAAVRQDLLADGLPVDQLQAVDGSGLDRSNRASCQLVLNTLVRDGPLGPIANGLPVAGQNGTLSQRMVHTPAAGRLHAKTGALLGVGGLTGWVFPPVPPLTPNATPGPAPVPVAFSLLVNGLPTQAVGEGLEDRIGVLLASYPQAPPTAQLGPLAPGGS